MLDSIILSRAGDTYYGSLIHLESGWGRRKEASKVQCVSYRGSLDPAPGIVEKLAWGGGSRTGAASQVVIVA